MSDSPRPRRCFATPDPQRGATMPVDVWAITVLQVSGDRKESTKIEFRYRRISQMDDVTDLVAMLFPGNRNQQHTAARILLALKYSDGIVASLSFLQNQFGISRRTLERTRAKLARLGLIEHVTWMNSRCGGQQGWKLSSRMSGALRLLADRIDAWRKDQRPERREKDGMLAQVLRPPEDY